MKASPLDDVSRRFWTQQFCWSGLCP